MNISIFGQDREYTLHHSYLLTAMTILVPKLKTETGTVLTRGFVQVLYNVQKEELSNSTSFERCPASTAGPIVTNLIAIVYWYGTVYNTGMEMLK